MSRKKAAKSKKRVCIHKAHIYDRCKNVKGGFLFKCQDGSKWPRSIKVVEILG